jgi:hypothetical protein
MRKKNEKKNKKTGTDGIFVDKVSSDVLFRFSL